MPVSEVIAYALAVGFGIRFVLPKAWLSARRLRPDINLLMVIAVAGAIGIGEWDETVRLQTVIGEKRPIWPWQVLRFVVLPIIGPSLIGVGLFGFTLSFDEFARTREIGAVHAP